MYSRSHPHTVTCLGNRAGLLMRSNQLEQALVAHRELIPLQIEAFGGDSPLVGFARVRLGQLLVQRGEPEAGYAELLAGAELFEALPRHRADAVRGFTLVAAWQESQGDAAGAAELRSRAAALVVE